MARNSTIGDQLLQEEDWLENLKENITKSKQLRNNMTSILESFEVRLTKLENIIKPLYHHTDQLHRRQQNINKALKAVDKTLGYYYAAANMDVSIKDLEPGDDLNKYIKQMNKLKEAMNFFSSELRNVSQVESTRSLFDFGAHSLEREFRQTLRQNQVLYKPQDLLDCIGDGYELQPKQDKLAVLPASCLENLSKISEWLATNLQNSEILNAYAVNRSDVVLRSLQLFSSKKTTSGPMGLALGHSPSGSRREGTSGAGRIGAAKKSLRQYAGDPTLRRQTLAVEQVTESGSDADAESFVLTLASLFLISDTEMGFAQHVFGEDQATTVVKFILQKPANFVLDQGEALLTNVRKSLNKQDFGSFLCLFPITRFIRDTKAKLNALLQNVSPELRTKYLDTVRFVDSVCMKGLEDFVEHIKTDQDKVIPKDGTVHQLTSNALVFLEQLVEHRESLGQIYMPNEPVSVANAKYFSRVLAALGLSLRSRAENYTDPFLKAIFMMNNFNHIYKTLQRINILKIVCEQNREVAVYYPQQVAEHKQLYISCWSRLIASLEEDYGLSPSPMLAGRLKDKDRQIVKELLQTFNREFEAIVSVQRSYSVPDQDLAGAIRREAKELVVKKYEEFYLKWSKIPFSKSPEKYLKYTPDDFSAMMSQLFDSKA